MSKHQSVIEIGGTDIRPGEKVTVNLPVADLYTSTSLNMPVQVVRAPATRSRVVRVSRDPR